MPGAPVFEGGRENADPHVLMHVLLALVVVIVAARLVGALFRKLQQPAVIGEVIMAVVTTFATSPILSLIMRPGREELTRGSDPASLAP